MESCPTKVDLYSKELDDSVLNAIRSNNEVWLQQLCTAGYPLDVKDNRGWRALHFCACTNFTGGLQILLDDENLKKINIDQQCFERKTPLLVAVENRSFEATKMLLDHGANPDLSDHFDSFPLIAATERRDLKTVQMLLDKGADINQQNYVQSTSLHMAVFKNDAAIVECLLQYSAKIDVKEDYGLTPVFTASQLGKKECLHLLLKEASEQGNLAVVNHPADDGATPLFLASQEGHSDIVEMLLAYGADANIMTSSGAISLPLQAAVEFGRVKCVNILAPKTEETLLPDCDLSLWSSVFIFPDSNVRCKIVRSLLSHGYDPNYVHRKEDTRITRFPPLLRFLPTEYLLFSNNLMPLVYAVLSEKYFSGTSAELLLNHGAYVNARHTRELPPLIPALELNKVDFAKELIKRGASINAYHSKIQGNLTLMLCLHKWKAFLFMLRHGVEVESFFSYSIYKSCFIAYKNKLRDSRKSVRGSSRFISPSEEPGHATGGTNMEESAETGEVQECILLNNVLIAARQVMGSHGISVNQALYRMITYCGNIPLDNIPWDFFESSNERKVIENLVSNPRTLVHYSRLAIRKAIGSKQMVCREELESTLQLPKLVMDLIYCADLES